MKGDNGRLVNLDVLAQYVGPNTALQRRISQKFLETARSTAHEMQQAALVGNYAQIGHLAHRFKPSALAMGATRIGDLAALLEHAANENCGEIVNEQLGYLVPMLAQLEWEISVLQ